MSSPVLRFRCPHCQKQYQWLAPNAGKTGVSKQCKNRYSVPTTPETGSVEAPRRTAAATAAGGRGRVAVIATSGPGDTDARVAAASSTRSPTGRHPHRPLRGVRHRPLVGPTARRHDPRLLPLRAGHAVPDHPAWELGSAHAARPRGLAVAGRADPAAAFAGGDHPRPHPLYPPADAELLLPAGRATVPDLRGRRRVVAVFDSGTVD